MQWWAATLLEVCGNLEQQVVFWPTRKVDGQVHRIFTVNIIISQTSSSANTIRIDEIQTWGQFRSLWQGGVMLRAGNFNLHVATPHMKTLWPGVRTGLHGARFSRTIGLVCKLQTGVWKMELVVKTTTYFTNYIMITAYTYKFLC